MNKKYRNPAFPKIVWRRLMNNEIVRKGDKVNAKHNPEYDGWIDVPDANSVSAICVSSKIKPENLCWVYRPIPHLSNLPDYCYE